MSVKFTAYLLNEENACREEKLSEKKTRKRLEIDVGKEEDCRDCLQ